MFRRLEKFSWFVLASNLVVILWGAVVRATGSGAGCGSHWPLCNGEVVPRDPSLKTLIEFSHRATSGLALILVLWLTIWVFRRLRAPHPARRMAAWSMGFMVGEAAVGAALVLLDYVDQNTASARAGVMAAHLMNTFLLLAALVLTSWSLRTGRGLPWRQLRRKPEAIKVALAAGGLLVVGATGAVAALGDTLFPASSLAEGLAQDFTAGAHPALRWRFLHPLAAVLVCVHLFMLCRPRLEGAGLRAVAPSSLRLSTGLVWLVLAQLTVGVVNVALLAPVGLQLLHLLLADSLWIVFVMWVADRWSEAPAG